MPARFAPLAPQEKTANRTMVRALPAPSLQWLDVVIFGAIVVLLRLF